MKTFQAIVYHTAEALVLAGVILLILAWMVILQ